MITGYFGKKLEKFQQQWVQVQRTLDVKTNGWSSVLISAIRDTFKPYSGITAASIAYFSLFSIFPLIILSISIASLNLNPELGWSFIINTFEFIAPALSQLIGNNISSIIQTRGPVSGIALAGLLWSASTIFITLTQALSNIWKQKRVRSFWKRRGLAILLVLAIGGPILFLASFMGSVINNLRSLIPDQILFLGPGASFIVAILLDIALLMVLYLLFPHGTSTWREILPGAVGAGLLWELAKKSFLLFVSSYVTASNLIYGSVAAIIAFLTWAYLSGLIFLFGAYVSLAVVHLKQRQLEAEDQIRVE